MENSEFDFETHMLMEFAYLAMTCLVMGGAITLNRRANRARLMNRFSEWHPPRQEKDTRDYSKSEWLRMADKCRNSARKAAVFADSDQSHEARTARHHFKLNHNNFRFALAFTFDDVQVSFWLSDDTSVSRCQHLSFWYNLLRSGSHPIPIALVLDCILACFSLL